jgi:hypothetical protein
VRRHCSSKKQLKKKKKKKKKEIGPILPYDGESFVKLINWKGIGNNFRYTNAIMAVASRKECKMHQESIGSSKRGIGYARAATGAGGPVKLRSINVPIFIRIQSPANEFAGGSS